MHVKIGIGQAVSMLLITVTPYASAYEVYNSFPGGRAASMAGVFSAQSDDSAGIWYNPAGMAMLDNIAQDYTIDWGEINERVLNTDADMTESFRDINTMKFIAAYAKQSNLFSVKNIGLGIYFKEVNRITVNVEEQQSLFNTNSYGRITQSTHQLSPVVSFKLKDDLSVGATVDFFWSGIECLDYSPCVKNDAYGLGWSLGMMYTLARFDANTINFAAVWRPSVELGYKSRNDNGLGRIIEDYLIDRPDSRSLGLNFQVPTIFGLVNTNLEFGSSHWSNVPENNTALDFSYKGIAFEFLINSRWINNLAVRSGWRKTDSSDIGNQYGVEILSVGLGYSPLNNHFIDVAFENKKGEFDTPYSLSALSFSYSYQK